MPDRQEKYVVPGDLTQNRHIEGLPFGTRGGATFSHQFPVDAEYIIRADLVERGGRIFGSNNSKGEQLEVTLDGERIALQDLTDYEVEDGTSIRMPVPAGPHTIAAAFVKRNHAPVEDVVQPYEFSLFEPAIDARSRLDVRAAPREREHHRAVQRRGHQRHADAQEDLRVPADGRGQRGRLRARDRRDARDARVSPPDRPRAAVDVDGLLRAGARRQGLRRRDRDGAATHPREPGVRVPLRARRAERQARRSASAHRRRARVAAVVLPVEQHPGRRAAVARGRQPAARAGRAAQAGAPHARRPALARADRELRGAVALSAQPRGQGRRRRAVPGLRRQPAPSLPHRDRDAVREHRARGSQRRRPADRGLHVRRRAARAALRHSRASTAASSAASRSRTTRAAACSARAASSWSRRTPSARRPCSAAFGCSRT